MNRFELNKRRYGGLPRGIYMEEDLLLTEDTSLMFQLINVPLTVSHHFVAIILDGEAEILYDSNKVCIQKNDFVIICQGHVTKLLNFSENIRVKMLFLNPDFGEYLRQKDYFPIFMRISRNPVVSLLPVELNIIQKFYDFFEILLKQKGTAHNEIAIHMFQMLFHVASKFENFGVEEERKQFREQQLFESFISLFKKNFKQSHEVSYYANMLCVSPNYLSKVSVNLTGKRLKRWINEALIDQACIMLRNLNGPSIKEISDLLGFANHTTFSKCFKAYMNISPREYRDSIR